MLDRHLEPGEIPASSWAAVDGGQKDEKYYVDQHGSSLVFSGCPGTGAEPACSTYITTTGYFHELSKWRCVLFCELPGDICFNNP